jgi:hypothetical protein
MDDERGAVVEVENQILRAPAHAHHAATGDASKHIFEPIAREHAGEIAKLDPGDALTDDTIEQ